jgi:predicted nucleic acid-binding protein
LNGDDPGVHNVVQKGRAEGSSIRDVARFVVDAGAVLELVRAGTQVSEKHKLLAPTLLRSQTLSMLHEKVQRDELTADVAREHLTRIRGMPVRLLGDAVLRRRAWELADRLGWAETYDAEYVALAQLQKCTLVTMDKRLARAVDGIVPTATLEVLR